MSSLSGSYMGVVSSEVYGWLQIAKQIMLTTESQLLQPIMSTDVLLHVNTSSAWTQHAVSFLQRTAATSVSFELI